MKNLADQQNINLINLNQELTTTLEHLKSAQQQLVESEKMASIGIVASRMAHEIQNPLNFVNNFSVISKDMLDEITDAATNTEEKQEIISILKENLEKICHHGKRAAEIINILQEHLRTGTTHKFFET